ncbi:MAG: hypothetical protein M3Z25_08275 [Actinomycetota bacterium]|nr:hypothetical protein [Actinomycetota bacterium]
MPIRSPKGRGAAYRSLWQWPLRSPARLIGCLVLLIAVGIGLNAATGLLGGRHSGGLFGSVSTSGPNAAPRPVAGATPRTAPATRLPPVAELTPVILPPSQAPAAALTTATRWTQAWAKHPKGATTDSWLKGLRPWTTEEYLGVLETVDPANVPATRVTGSARAVSVSPKSVRVEVPTDALTVLVLVTNTDNEWRVAGYDRATPSGPGAGPSGPAGSGPSGPGGSGPSGAGPSPAQSPRR